MTNTTLGRLLLTAVGLLGQLPCRPWLDLWSLGSYEESWVGSSEHKFEMRHQTSRQPLVKRGSSRPITYEGTDCEHLIQTAMRDPDLTFLPFLSQAFSLSSQELN